MVSLEQPREDLADYVSVLDSVRGRPQVMQYSKEGKLDGLKLYGSLSFVFNSEFANLFFVVVEEALQKVLLTSVS